MTLLWPRLPAALAEVLFADLQSGMPLQPSEAHPGQVYAQVGGRATAAHIAQLRREVIEVANGFGCPQGVLTRADRVSFDRAVADRVRAAVDVTWAEAGSREIWSFLALVVLPDVTEWRWAHTLPDRNRERWVASDLTRHTWARLWWQVTSFESAPDALDRLNESELNQLLERRAIGGHPKLLAAFVAQALGAIDQGAPRRPLIRDSSRRLRRRLAYIDGHALTDPQRAEFARQIVHESWTALSTQSPDAWSRAGLGESEVEGDE